MGAEHLRVPELFRDLGIDPSTTCLTINGFVDAELTTLDSNRFNGQPRRSKGDGCYKYGIGPDRIKPFNPNIQKPRRRR